MESRYQKTVDLCVDYLSFCGRFILPMLYEEQPTKFVTEKGEDIVYYSWERSGRREVVLGIWMYIKDNMNETKSNQHHCTVHEFIDDAYFDNPYLATDFRNQLLYDKTYQTAY